MCGIFGVIGHRPDRDWNTLASLTAYRGPDSSNIWASDDAVFGHNRLSIIDLTTAANQPMLSRNGRYILIYNGEIFNFQELRAELESLGVHFSTNSDTEVLLEGYIAWGQDILQKVDGMFSFAIWDKQSKQLFASRDHTGIKPFFYSYYQGVFSFSSEIKTILAADLVPRNIREDSILEYLAYSYIPAPKTAYIHVQCLEPGQSLIFDLSSSHLVFKNWWSIPVHDSPLSCSFEEAKSEFSRLFSKSIQRRIITDVPLGAFLSGGLDSSAIVAEMTRASTKKVNTFSIGYLNNTAYDESSYAQLVASHLGTEHQTIYPEFSANDLDYYLNLIVNQFDQPYGNATVILTAILTHNVRDKVTVALVGDGGDELFGGYPRHYALALQKRFGPLIRLSRSPLLSLLRMLPETPSANHLRRRLRRFLTSSDSDLGLAFEESSRLFPTNQLQQILRPSLKGLASRQTFLSDLFHEARGAPLIRACYTDQKSFLPFNLLEGADRMSMVNSFELRLPFLDRELMEFAAALPSEFRIHGRMQKRILKEAYRDKLPPFVINRPKRGFNPPVWHWLKENKVLLDTIARPRSMLSEYIDSAAIRGMLDRFHTNAEDNSTQLWSLLVLDRWLIRQG